MQPAAPLPRALDVQRFAAGREQEIRALQAAIKADEGAQYGAAALPRHLRRRTRSHNPYKHSKRPNAKRKRSSEQAPDGGGQQQDGGEAEAPWENRRMRRKTGRLQSAAQQACSWAEGESLRLEPSTAEAAAAAAAAASPESTSVAAKRLETHIWHAKRLAMTQRWGWHLPEGAAGRGLGSRSFLHQVATSAAVHDASYHCPLSLAGASSMALLSVLGSVLGPQGLALLRQHLLHGPGRPAALGGQVGSSAAAGDGKQGAPPAAAAARPAAAGASSSAALAGGPSSSSSSMQDGGAHCMARGMGWELEVMLHRPGAFPGRAIAPARIMWLPKGSSSIAAGAGPAAAADAPLTEAGSGGGDRAAAAMDLDLDLDPPAAATGGRGVGQRGRPAGEQSGSTRPDEVQLCIWVHAAAAEEALRALQQAAAAAAPGAVAAAGSAGGSALAECDQSGPLPPDRSQGVRVGVLDLRRVELRGAAASRALASALFSHAASQERAPPQQQQQQQQQQGQQQRRQQEEKLTGVGGARTSNAQAAAASEAGQAGKGGRAAPMAALPAALRELEGGQALQLALADPRLAKPVALGSASATLLPGSPAPAATASLLSPSSAPPQPLPEAAISSRRQHLRRQMLGLDDGLSSELALGLGPGMTGIAASRLAGSKGAAGASLAAAMEGVEAASPSHAVARAGAEGSGGPGCEEDEVRLAAYCPAALVRHDPPGANGIPGWSLLVPGGWVLPFWLALAFAGAKPAGQREWRWAHTVEGRPFFPHDYPDTQAYAATMRQLGEEQRAHAAKRPKGKYTPPAPFPPPWRQLATAAEQAQQQQQQQQHGVPAAPAAAPAMTAAAATASIPAEVAAIAGGSSGAGTTPAAASASSAGAAPADAFPRGWYVAHGDGAGAGAPGLPTASWAPPGAARPVLLGLSQQKPPPLRWQPRQLQEQAGASQAVAVAVAGEEGEGGRVAEGGGTGKALGGADVAGSSGSKEVQEEPGISGAAAAAAGGSAAQGAPPEPAATPAAAAAQKGSAGPNSEAGAGVASPRALVAVCVHIVKRGAAKEGAEILGDMSWGGAQIPGVPAAASQPTSSQPAASQPADSQPQQPLAGTAQHAGAAQQLESAAQLEVGPVSQPAGGPALSLLGFVTSELPRGAPKRGGSMGLACCAALWRLRGLQHSGKRRDRGEISAFVRNPNSTALHPVRLRLLEVWQ